MVFADMGNLAKGALVCLLALVVGFLVAAQVQSQIATTQGIADVTNESQWTTAYSATVTTTNAVATIPGWIPLIILVGIASLILMLVKQLA